MPVKKLVEIPEKVLRQKTARVSAIDQGVKELARDMFDTMYLNNGVGLSANQIGISKRIAVMNPTGKKEDEIVLINPKITGKSGSDVMEEGCLSIPGASGKVKRALEVRVEYTDIGGRTIKATFKGLSARIVQHELDHLNGFLFIDRLNFFRRLSALSRRKKGKEK